MDKRTLLLRTLFRAERGFGAKVQPARRVVRWLVGHDRYYHEMLQRGDPTSYEDFDYFERRERTIDTGEFSDIAEALQRFPRRVRRVLDVGCGTGLLALHLRDSGFDVVGCDLDDRALSVCKRRGIRVFRADATRLPFPNGAFDAVVTQHLVEHCDPPRAAVLETLRVSRLGTVHVVPAHPTTDVTHRIPYFTPALVAEVFEGLAYTFCPDAHSIRHPQDLDFVVTVSKDAFAGAREPLSAPSG